MKTRKAAKLNKKQRHIIFIILCLFFLAFLANFLIVMVTPNRGIRAYGSTQVLAVPRGQEIIDSRIKVKVIRITSLDINVLEPGMILVVNNPRNPAYFWVEEVVSIDRPNNQLVTSFDGFLTSVIDIDDIEGVFVRESNFFGILYYVSTQPRGFAFTSLFVVLLLGAVYVAFIYDRKANL